MMGRGETVGDGMECGGKKDEEWKEQMELATSIHCFGFFLDGSEAVLQSSCGSPIIHAKRNVCRKSTSKLARKFKLMQSVLGGRSKHKGRKVSGLKAHLRVPASFFMGRKRCSNAEAVVPSAI